MTGVDGDAVVRFENVGLRYGLGPEVLQDVSLVLEPGSYHFLVGPSGAGKTSLLRLLYLALRPTRGLITLFGHDIATTSRRHLPGLRRRIGVVFQEFRLLDHLSAMIITCPSCTTRYSIDPGALGSGGKQVRCSNCGFQWTQPPTSVVEAAANYAFAAVHPQPAAAPAPPPPPPPPPAPPPAVEVVPPPEPAPPPPPEPAPPPEPQPEPEPEPQPIAEPQPQPAAPPEREPEEAAEIEVEISPDDEGEPLSDEELDAMLGRDDEPEPVESLVETDEDEVSRDVEVADDMPEPEPIPAVFTTEEADSEPEPKSNRMKFVIAGSVLVLVIIFGGLFLARDAIVSVLPSAAGIYDAIGLGPGKDALVVRQDSLTTKREIVGAKEVLVVRGQVMNTSEEAQAVPRVRVTLYDPDDDGEDANDPFGRSPGGGFRGIGGERVKIPDQMEVQRAHRILRELRRRAGERHRPQKELDYIERLLKRF